MIALVRATVFVVIIADVIARPNCADEHRRLRRPIVAAAAVFWFVAAAMGVGLPALQVHKHKRGCMLYDEIEKKRIKEIVELKAHSRIVVFRNATTTSATRLTSVAMSRTKCAWAAREGVSIQRMWSEEASENVIVWE